MQVSKPDFPELVGVGALFIDDIVKPDGTTHMGVLGGAVTHALMGAAIWDERPGLCAFCGEGLPQDSYKFISAHLDLRGLITLDLPQVRAWQIFEFDGRRRELHRVEIVAPFVEGAQPQNLPDAYKYAKAFYLLQDFDGILRWRNHVDGILLWEPNQLVMIPENAPRFRKTLQTKLIDIVSPNLLEARTVYGDLSPEALVDLMLADGAKMVVLRMGEAGSFVADHSEQHHIPAYQTRAIDTTGAGNTYCGAFLTGILHDKSLLECGVMGTVAASFCIEQIGVVDPSIVPTSLRDQRYSDLKP